MVGLGLNFTQVFSRTMEEQVSVPIYKRSLCRISRGFLQLWRICRDRPDIETDIA